jgi:transcriptional regulator with XRE-family HTH domain
MKARQNLARWLKLRGLTQAQAAAEVGASQSTVSKWINGDSIPRWQVMQRLERWSQGHVRITDWVSGNECGAEYQDRAA